MKPGERLAALEGLRGYAAMLVFFTHAFGMLFAKLYYPLDLANAYLFDTADPLRNALTFLYRSNHGVDLFFVLSGLLMADIAVRRWPGAGRFLARRALRIYPPYLASTVIVAVVVFYTMQRAVGLHEGAANVALLQGIFPLGIRAINGVTWSLTFEAGFYIAVPFLALAWSRRDALAAHDWFAVLAAFVAIVATCALIPGENAMFLAYFALFAPGIAAGMLDDESRVRFARRVPTALVVLAWASFAIGVKTGVVANTQPVYYAASAIACGLLVLKACDPDGALAKLFQLPVMRWLGRYSYSIFLIHDIVVHLWAGAVTSWIGTDARFAFTVVFLGGALAFSLAAARLLYALTERWYFSARRAEAGPL